MQPVCTGSWQICTRLCSPRLLGSVSFSYHISSLLIRMLLVGQKLLKTWDGIIFWNWTPSRNEGNKNVMGDALSVLGKVWNKCSPTQKSCPSSNSALAWRNILQIMWRMLIANVVDTHKLINLYWKVDHCWEKTGHKTTIMFLICLMSLGNQP